MRIDISLFGALLMFMGFNWFHWCKWWAGEAYKRSPIVIINQKVTEVFVLVMGITTMAAGLVFLIWGILGAHTQYV
jgi:hypothetical protein